MSNLLLQGLKLAATLAAGLVSLGATGQEGPAKSTAKPVLPPAEQPFVVEYYYKAKWGHADEFIALFNKNHLPLLLNQIELGRLLQESAVAPRYHTTEDGRWDYRVTIVFKNVSTVNDGFDESALAKQLFPDQETFKREEQRRFEILDGHWDVPIKTVDLSAK
jgi:hypothetical protein